MNRHALQKLASTLREDASPAEVAATFAPYAATYALTDSERGDTALVGGGGHWADQWGKGVRKGDVPGARSLFANVPDDTNIGIRVNGIDHVFDVRTRRVRGPRSIRDGSVRSPTHSRPRQSGGGRETAKPPAPPSHTKARAAFRKADAEMTKLDAELREEEKSLADLQTGAQRAEERAARRKEHIGRSFVDALREKRDPPDFTEDRDTILRDETEASARRSLIPEAEERVRQAKLALERHKRARSEASMGVAAALTAAAVRDAEQALGQLVEPLAALEAVTIVRAQLLGNSFAFDPRQHPPPLGAAEIVSAIVGGIPPSLAASLSRDAINTRAHKIAAEFLADLQPRNDGE